MGVVARPVVVAAWVTASTSTSLGVLEEIKVFRQIATLFEFEKFVVVPTATLGVLEKIKVFVFGVKACVGGIVVFVVFRVNKCLGVEAEIVLLGHDDRGRVENEKRR